MAAENALNSLRIKGFRTFDELVIPSLSAVNLIVGRNGVGKTSVLEALYLYFTDGDRDKISQLLVSRDELSYRRSDLPENIDEYGLALQSLFYGRPSLRADLPKFSIGPANTERIDRALTIEMTYLRRELNDLDGSVRLRKVSDEELVSYPDAMLGFRIGLGQRGTLVPISRLGLRTARVVAPQPVPKAIYLSSAGLGSRELARLWDSIALTDDEELVLGALRSMSDPIERLVLVENPSASRERIMMGKVARFSEPIPVKSLGEGINHILGVILSLIQARGGCLLADEIENGIHYSRQAELWRLIFRQAAKGQTQVIATTHSWDCVVGFQVAAMEQEDFLPR